MNKKHKEQCTHVLSLPCGMVSARQPGTKLIGSWTAEHLQLCAHSCLVELHDGRTTAHNLTSESSFAIGTETISRCTLLTASQICSSAGQELASINGAHPIFKAINGAHPMLRAIITT